MPDSKAILPELVSEAEATATVFLARYAAYTAGLENRKKATNRMYTQRYFMQISVASLKIEIYLTNRK